MLSTKSRSAIGSRSCPTRETMSNRRAMTPSSQSVTALTARSAERQQVVLGAERHPDERPGSDSSRSADSAFGMVRTRVETSGLAERSRLSHRLHLPRVVLPTADARRSSLTGRRPPADVPNLPERVSVVSTLTASDETSNRQPRTSRPPPNGPYQVRGVRRIIWREPVTTEARRAHRMGRGRGRDRRRQGVLALPLRPVRATSRSVTAATAGSGSKPNDAAIPRPRSVADRRPTAATDRACRTTVESVPTPASAARSSPTPGSSAHAKTWTPRERSQLVAMAAHCPSGALTLTLEGADVEPTDADRDRPRCPTVRCW